jgi:uncharacterized Zn-binding protein involved in type VI secretion
MADAAIQYSRFTHPYTVEITSFSDKTKNQSGAWLVRDGDTVTCTQHGAQTIIGTAAIAKDLDGKKFAKVGDVTTCGAVISVGDDTIQWS